MFVYVWNYACVGYMYSDVFHVLIVSLRGWFERFCVDECEISMAVCLRDCVRVHLCVCVNI